MDYRSSSSRREGEESTIPHYGTRSGRRNGARDRTFLGKRTSYEDSRSAAESFPHKRGPPRNSSGGRRGSGRVQDRRSGRPDTPPSHQPFGDSLPIDDARSRLDKEAGRRETMLIARLSDKEQKITELQTQVAELRARLSPADTEVRTLLLDPVINEQFNALKEELRTSEEKVRRLEEDLHAVSFDQESKVGKKLIAKLRRLKDENEEFGEKLSQGRVQKLELELILQREYAEELRKSLHESNEFVMQLDEEVDTMQRSILSLQRQLQEAKERTKSPPGDVVVPVGETGPM